MPGPFVYWFVTGLVLLIATCATILLVKLSRGGDGARRRDPRNLPGTATAAEVRQAAGARSVIRRARHARPSLTRPHPREVGYFLGRSHGVATWASVEDSILVVGPPRSGKGLHLVVPTILNAPGAVVTTSTRPDNLALTYRARRAHGPVAVFDPQQLATGISDALRWSPVRGCEVPQIAMIRARGLAAGTGMSRTVDGGDFWQGQTEAVLRALLHAAALDEPHRARPLPLVARPRRGQRSHHDPRPRRRRARLGQRARASRPLRPPHPRLDLARRAPSLVRTG